MCIRDRPKGRKRLVRLMKRLRKLKNACRGLKTGGDNIRGQGLPARIHKVNCFRASEPRPYGLNDSIIHVLTHSTPYRKNSGAIFQYLL